MRSIAHIINVTEITEAKKPSYLHIAQPVTFRSMLEARQEAAGQVAVELLAVKHASETVEVPEGFKLAPDLQRYGWEYIPALRDAPGKRPLPRLADIIQAAYECTEAEYLVYSNLDIGLQKHFYQRMDSLIGDGYDAITVNRRDLPKTCEGQTLDASTLDLIRRCDGKLHPGIDCVVFRRASVPKLELGNVFIGFPPVGQVLKTQAERHASKPLWIKDEKLCFHLGEDVAWQQGAEKHAFWLQNEREAAGLFDPQFRWTLGERVTTRLREMLGRPSQR